MLWDKRLITTKRLINYFIIKILDCKLYSLKILWDFCEVVKVRLKLRIIVKRIERLRLIVFFSIK